MSLMENSASTQWQTYLDETNDVIPYLQMSGDTISATTKGLLQTYIDMGCQWVQNFLGRPVAPTKFDRRFNGWSGWQGAYIELPYYPVLEVVSVNEYWGVAGPHLLVEQTPTNQVDGFQCDYQKGLLIRVFPGLVQKPWFPGSRNIEVQWVAGYNPVPADLKIATLDLIAYWWRNTQQASRSFHVPGQEYGGASTNPGLWQGVPNRIKDLLSAYLQVGIG